MSDENQSSKRKQNRGVMVRLPPRELSKAEALARSFGISVQGLFRKFIGGTEIPKVILDHENGREILVSLNWIGNNINKVARKINVGSQRGWFHEFDRTAAELRETQSVLRRHLGYL